MARKAETNTSVKVNCLPQNCYLRAFNPVASSRKGSPCKKYYELQEKQIANGLIYDLVECDYPITKESVKSYESSTNYKTDPDGAIRTNQKNLGDVTEVQRVLQEDARNFMETYQRVAAQLEEYNKKKTPEAAPEQPKEENK